MSQGIRTPGPQFLFAKFNNITTAQFLGTCIAAPESEEEKFKLEVMNDLGGRSVPFQLVQDGEKWMALLAMNRFDYRVVGNIRALESGVAPVFPGPNPGLGSETPTARGTLNIGISDWQLIIVNSYFSTTSAGQFIGGIQNADLIPGRMFYSCNLRKYKETTQGTRVLDIAMAVECQNLYDPVTRGFSCYTEDSSKFPALAPIT